MEEERKILSPIPPFCCPLLGRELKEVRCCCLRTAYREFWRAAMERRERAGRDASEAIEGETATRFTGGMAEVEGDAVRGRGGGGSGCKWCDSGSGSLAER